MAMVCVSVGLVSLSFLKSYNEYLKIMWLLFSCLLIALAAAYDLQSDIRNTEQLISLYERKLDLLKQLRTNNSQLSSQGELNAPKQNSITHRKVLLFKKQEQSVWQVNTNFAPNARFIEPSYISSANQLYDLSGNLIEDSNFRGVITNAAYKELTTSYQGHLLMYRLKTQLDSPTAVTLSSTSINVRASQQYGFWHRAAHFQDEYVEYVNNEVTLTPVQSAQPKKFTFRSDVIALFSVNQYKILFVTRYYFGVLNTRSLHISEQTEIGSIAESACYKDGIMHILLKNRTILTVAQQKVVRSTNFTVQVVKSNTKIVNLNSYLILYSNTQPCFHVLQMKTLGYHISYLKELCIPHHTLPIDFQQSQAIQFQFFRYKDNYGVLLSSRSWRSSQQYQFQLPLIEPGSDYHFPWKFAFIVLGVAGFILYRSRGQSKPAQRSDRGGAKRVQKRVKPKEESSKKSQKYNEMEMFLTMQKNKQKQRNKSKKDQ